MRPDVIVHYPDGKDVIIDSKVSLTAYTDYMNAEDETVRSEALDRHLLSVRNHIKELKKKNYTVYNSKSGRDTVDFVLMFIPNEGPFHLAMLSAPTLWNDAFQEKVLIVSPTNLMSLLKIIHIAWTREEQNRNQQEILKTAAELLDRLYSFYNAFDNIGTQLEKVQKAYDDATNRLKQKVRNHSVVHSGEKLKQLGVRMTKQLKMPASLKTVEELALEENTEN
jgi:DNA recombination protein RmuC